MTDTPFDDLVEIAAPSVPGCPFPTVSQAIRRSAIKTCERTLAYRYSAAKYQLLPGVFEYSFPIPDNTECCAIISADINDNLLLHLTLEQARDKYPKWPVIYSGEDPDILFSLTPGGPFNESDYNVDAFNDIPDFVLPPEVVADGGEPQIITQVTADQYAVVPLPDDNVDYFIKLFLALKPKRTATGMDSVACSELQDTIIHGALEQLLVLPNVPWADRELAAYHAKQYLFHTSERRARTNLGAQRGSLRVRPVPFS